MFQNLETCVIENILKYLNNKALYNLGLTSSKIRNFVRDYSGPCDKCYKDNLLCLKQKCFDGCLICCSEGLILKNIVAVIEKNKRRDIHNQNKLFSCTSCSKCDGCKRFLDIHISHNFIFFEFNKCQLCNQKFCRSSSCKKYFNPKICELCKITCCKSCYHKCNELKKICCNRCHIMNCSNSSTHNLYFGR